MKTLLRVGVAAMAVALGAHAQAAPVDIKGRWVVDLAPMVAQARAAKASEKSIEGMKRTFVDGLMVIDAKTIKMSILNLPGDPVSLNYKIVASKGNCVGVVVDVAAQTSRYCVDGDVLSIHDPSTATVVVHRRQ